MQLVAVHFIPRLFAHCLSWAGQLGPSMLHVRHLVWSSQQPCQIDKVLQMRKKAQGKLTCPGTHSSWMVGLGSNPQSSDSSSLDNNSTAPGQLSPHHTCSALIVTHPHLHLSWVGQASLNKGNLSLAEPHHKGAYWCSRQWLCVCVCVCVCIDFICVWSFFFLFFFIFGCVWASFLCKGFL